MTATPRAVNVLRITHPGPIGVPRMSEPAARYSSRPPLDRAALADVVDLALWAGSLLMEYGAESQRVEQTVRDLGHSLGCDWGNVLVTQNAIIVTHVSGADFRTKLRRVSAGPVNMGLLEGLSHLTHRATDGHVTRAEARAQLAALSAAPRSYGHWLTACAVGLACAAFCRLFGGTASAACLTWAASALAMRVRQLDAAHAFNPLLVAVVTAFVASGLVGAFQHLLPPDPKPEAALAASVLLLVPGVPVINAAEDLIKGHVVVGVARATGAALVVLAATLGLILALHATAARL